MNSKNLKKLPNKGDLVGVTPHPSDPAQAFPHTGYPHWGIPMWEGPLPNKYNLEWKAWVTKYLDHFQCLENLFVCIMKF